VSYCHIMQNLLEIVVKLKIILCSVIECLAAYAKDLDHSSVLNFRERL
jgi:hypothetical protein